MDKIFLKGIIQEFDKVNRNPSRPYYYDDTLPILKKILRREKIKKLFRNE
jgi:hypothetical protein